jgi:hypothetical protein
MATPMDRRMIGHPPIYMYGRPKRLKAKICGDGIVTKSWGFSACIWMILTYGTGEMNWQKPNDAQNPLERHDRCMQQNQSI